MQSNITFVNSEIVSLTLSFMLCWYTIISFCFIPDTTETSAVLRNTTGIINTQAAPDVSADGPSAALSLVRPQTPMETSCVSPLTPSSVVASPTVVSPNVSTVVSPDVSTVVSPDVSTVVSPGMSTAVSPGVSTVVSPGVSTAVSPGLSTVVSPDVSFSEMSPSDPSLVPVLDISDPAQLLELLSTGELLVETIDESVFVSGDNALSDFNNCVVGCDGDAAVGAAVSVSEVIDEVFLPPKIENRPATSKTKAKKTSHTILTCEEILSQKRELQIKKNAKAAKKVKKEKS